MNDFDNGDVEYAEAEWGQSQNKYPASTFKRIHYTKSTERVKGDQHDDGTLRPHTPTI